MSYAVSLLGEPDAAWDVLQETNLKGNSAVKLNPDEEVIDSIEFDDNPYSRMQREFLILSRPIKLQFDLGHRAGLYRETNAPAHATGCRL